MSESINSIYDFSLKIHIAAFFIHYLLTNPFLIILSIGFLFSIIPKQMISFLSHSYWYKELNSIVIPQTLNSVHSVVLIYYNPNIYLTILQIYLVNYSIHKNYLKYEYEISENIRIFLNFFLFILKLFYLFMSK
jgi:hypothetical protein